MKKKYRRLSLAKVTLYPLVLSPVDTVWAEGGAIRIAFDGVTRSNCLGPCQSLDNGLCQVNTEGNCSYVALVPENQMP